MTDFGRFYVRLSVARHAVDETAASRVAWAEGRYAHTLEQALEAAQQLVAAFKEEIADNFTRAGEPFVVAATLPEIVVDVTHVTAPLRDDPRLAPDPYEGGA